MTTIQTFLEGQQPGLWADAGAVPLQHVDVAVTLALPLARTTLAQTYRNALPVPIEARYVFPVPFHAVLLGLKLTLGEDVIEGVVTPNADAEATYERAVSAGDAALLVRRLTDCLYAVQVGNLKPDETLRVEITWAEPLSVTDAGVSYRLPTVVAPHYGDPRRAGVPLTDVPTTSASVAYELMFSAELTGALSAAAVTSDTHGLEIIATPERTLVRLAEDAWLDRALTLDLALTTLPRASVWTAPDGEGTAVLAAVMPEATCARTGPRHLTVVIDASGSMEGASITQAREAVQQMLDRLAPDDTVYVLAFGSTPQAITPARLPVKALSRTTRQAIARLEATLGGTELVAALNEALLNTPESGDILLITDGQCYLSDTERRRLMRPGVRYFTIGVGRDTSEQLLRRLAIDSQGACTFVTPDEDMTPRIVQHVRRLLAQPVSVRWQWPVLQARHRTPAVAFAGDLTLSQARFNTPLAAQALTVLLDNEAMSVTVTEAPDWLRPLLPRLVAHALLPEHNLTARRREAVHYQLVTDQTSLVAVKQRAPGEQTTDMPWIVDVPQMDVMSESFSAPPPKLRMRLPKLSLNFTANEDQYGAYDKPAYQRLAVPTIAALAKDLATEDAFWDNLTADLAQGKPLDTFLTLDALPSQLRAKAEMIMRQEPEPKFMQALLLLAFKKLPLLRRVLLGAVGDALKTTKKKVRS